MDTPTLVGLVAGTLTTLSFIPQVAKVFRTRRARDISLPMYAVFSLGLVLWLIYGIALGSAPIIVTNLVTLLLTSMVITMKLRYG